MKITVLAENTTCRQDCLCEHGLSLYIEYRDRKILFDTGQTGIFADNARTLGIDLAAVDAAVLSHGHYDHGGGVHRFFEENRQASLYLSSHAFGEYYSGPDKYIGLDRQLKGHPRLIPVSEKISLTDGADIIPWGEQDCHHPSYGRGLTVRENGSSRPDDFRHEQYLMFEEDGRRVLVSGCSHKGVLNIMERFRPDVLVGGFHFMKLAVDGDDRAELVRLAGVLSDYPTEYFTCHCTGAEQFQVLRPVMGDRLRYISSGMTFEI